MTYLTWTKGGLLRAVSYQGQREDRSRPRSSQMTERPAVTAFNRIVAKLPAERGIEGRTIRDAMARAEWAVETKLAFRPLPAGQRRLG